MKKILAMILALAMVLSMSAFAFATEKDAGSVEDEHSGLVGGDTSKSDVKVSVRGTGEVYYITVTWDSLSFIYNQGTWDTVNHKYIDSYWTDNRDTASIEIGNHSNMPIWYTAVLAEQNVEGFDTELTDNTQNAGEIPAAIGANYYGKTAYPKAELTVKVTADPEKVDTATTSTKTLGTITITISSTDPNAQ